MVTVQIAHTIPGRQKAAASTNRWEKTKSENDWHWLLQKPSGSNHCMLQIAIEAKVFCRSEKSAPAAIKRCDAMTGLKKIKKSIREMKENPSPDSMLYQKRIK